MSETNSVKSFFQNKSILITGATGFVAKLIMYKLLISCDVDKIYVLIRPKRRDSFEKRAAKFVDQQLSSLISDKSILAKIHPIEGDICLKNLGLSESDNRLITDNVSIVYHSAATIRFNSPLKEAVAINVCGTLEVIELCKRLNTLDAFVHISTAYCNPHHELIEDQVYENHVKPDDAIALTRLLDNKQIELIESSYLGCFPNTYTFTKNLAENLIKEKCASMPVAILRPSVVTPSVKEPDVGWIDAMNGIIGVFVLSALGLARARRFELDMIKDLIPVDIFANISVVAAYATACHFNKEVKVYNSNSHSLHTITNIQYQRYLKEVMDEYPLAQAVRPPAGLQGKYGTHPLVYYPTKYISEFGYAYLCDAYLYLTGKPRKAMKYMRGHHICLDIWDYFGRKKMRYTNENVLRLRQLLSPSEASEFDVDIKAIDWRQYTRDSYFGGRKYLAGEKEVNVQRDRQRMALIKLGLGIFNGLLMLALFYAMFKIYQIVFA